MWAQTSPVIDGLLIYGPLGAVVVALLLGYLWAKPAVEAQRRDHDSAMAQMLAAHDATLTRALHDKARIEQQRDDMYSAYTREVLPTIAEFTRATALLLPVLHEVVGRLERTEGARRGT